MMGKICALFGHRHAFNLGNMEELKERLTTVLTTLIEKEGVDTFLVGGYGDFDLLAGNVTHTLKKNFRQLTHGLFWLTARNCLAASRCRRLMYLIIP